MREQVANDVVCGASSPRSDSRQHITPIEAGEWNERSPCCLDPVFPCAPMICPSVIHGRLLEECFKSHRKSGRIPCGQPDDLRCHTHRKLQSEVINTAAASFSSVRDIFGRCAFDERAMPFFERARAKESDELFAVLCMSRAIIDQDWSPSKESRRNSFSGKSRL